jgi:tRNA-Thr(GGU) m(6)t(6)A37 methyltransferase TsaA
MESPVKNKTFELYPIGYVQAAENSYAVQILEPFRPALKQLGQFSHVNVLWWADQHDNEQARSLMQVSPPYAEDKLTGVFACRAEFRPNPIAVTTAPILEVDEEQGLVRLAYIDAYDGTPVVDLKAYFPVSDRVREARLPEWLSDWPQWLEDAYQLAF